jgi:hypothetical protein
MMGDEPARRNASRDVATPETIDPFLANDRNAKELGDGLEVNARPPPSVDGIWLT